MATRKPMTGPTTYLINFTLYARTGRARAQARWQGTRALRWQGTLPCTRCSRRWQGTRALRWQGGAVALLGDEESGRVRSACHADDPSAVE